jgi:very-short-patch-repair endonuclease
LSKSELEDALACQLDIAGLKYRRQHRFHPKRRWLLDFAFPRKKVSIEVEGGIWTGGRHTRGDGFEKDCEKQNTAVCMGWKYLRVTDRHIREGTALKWVLELVRKQRKVG